MNDMGGAPRRHSAHIAPLGNTLHVAHVAILTMCRVLQYAAVYCSACRARIVYVYMRTLGAKFTMFQNCEYCPVCNVSRVATL